MSDDDLDAFFEEVNEVEKDAVDKVKVEEEPPKKKLRPDIQKGVVVAAASAEVIKKGPEASEGQKSATLSSAVVPPTSHQTTEASQSVGATTGHQKVNKSKPESAKESNKSKPPLEFRLFVGNLDPSVSDLELYEHFSEYPSLLRANVVRDARKNNVSKGFGFVAFGDALQMAKALRSKDQSWLQSRPIRIKRSRT